jgi:hypothetical protein
MTAPAWGGRFGRFGFQFRIDPNIWGASEQKTPLDQLSFDMVFRRL